VCDPLPSSPCVNRPLPNDKQSAIDIFNNLATGVVVVRLCVESRLA
jgi:hypothetical protein